MVLWLMRIFVLSRWLLRPRFFSTFLESTQHFPKLFFGCCEQQHVVGESQVCEAVRGRGRSGIYPFFFLVPSLNFILQWILKDCVKQQAGQRITLPGTFSNLENVAVFVRLYGCLSVSVYLLQETDVIVIDVAGFVGVPNWLVSDGIERIREVNCRCPHFDSPLVAFLLNQSVRCKVVCCLVRFLEANLIFCFFLVKHWVKSSVQNCREQVCTTQEMSNSGGSYSHFPRLLPCVSLLSSLSSNLQAWVHFSS